MKKVQVEAPGGSYPILIGEGSTKNLVPWIKKKKKIPSSFHLVSDSKIFPIHGKKIVKALESLNVPVTTTIIPSGEKSKSTSKLEKIWRDAISQGIDRRGCVVALGGGVVGDLAGMAAATILRGVDFIQIPTTLLAMVDSSVGGKTGINLPEGKNLVGAFYQPQAVFVDLAFLKSLPPREVSAGWAEIIKAAAIRDPRLFTRLEKEYKNLTRKKPIGLDAVIATACKIKAQVVTEDEREAGLRMILNFGHTLAHGLEAALGYGGLLHGEAVSIGMHFAARLGLALGQTQPEVVERLLELLKHYKLPVDLQSATLGNNKKLSPAKVLNAMLRDKKKGPAGLRWVFVPKIGNTFITDEVPWETVQVSVKTFLKGN